MPRVLATSDLQRLFDELHRQGYVTIAPTISEQTILFRQVASIEELPIGWTDQQEGGKYRLVRREDNAYFGYVVGPESWKRLLFPPRQLLYRSRRRGTDVEIKAEQPEIRKYALIGVRSCDLEALKVFDKVQGGSEHTEPNYLARRQQVFIVAVNCVVTGGTCFCVSMQTGPRAAKGYDLALTEVVDQGGHRFFVETGSERGEALVNVLRLSEADDHLCREADRLLEDSRQRMGRQIDTTDIKDLLYRNFEHPRWEQVADRCLSCGNCTMVCPTCFCVTVEDTTDLTGSEAVRTRRWDSCFTLEHSYLHGGSVRTSVASRYRQWMTHKLASWHDQFGMSGCVGCGRCITWCPVGIDLTEEAAAIRTTDRGMAAKKVS